MLQLKKEPVNTLQNSAASFLMENMETAGLSIDSEIWKMKEK